MKPNRIALFLLFAAVILFRSVQAAEKMNVLLIVSDDLRAELGVYASPVAKTPQLDRLASTGVRFDRAYCQFPLCNPSRASMLTGRTPLRTGVLGNRTWFGDQHPDLVSLPRYFKNHGYTSIRVGKIFHHGIDDTDAWSVNGQERFLAGIPNGKKPGKPGDRNETRKTNSETLVVLPGDGENHVDFRTADQTIAYLRQFKDRPFFLGCGFLKPHTPLEAPQRFYDLWKLEDIPLPSDFAEKPTVPAGFPAGCIRPRNADLFVNRPSPPDQAREVIRAYLAATAFMDWNVGRVLHALDELGLREKTIVVFWGDNGYQLGEKGKWSKAGSLWEQGTRTPLLVCDPRRRDSRGKTCPALVQMVDVYPTLAELCSLPIPSGLDGRSLAPLLDQPGLDWNHPAFSVWSEDGKSIAGIMVRSGALRYADFFGRGAGSMLTDLESDPDETKNLVDDPARKTDVERLRALVRDYLSACKASQ